VVACFTKDLDEDISSVNRAQEWQTPKAGEGHEMQMPLSVAANQSVGHGTEKSKPRPFKVRKGRPPGKAVPGVRLAWWYCPACVLVK